MSTPQNTDSRKTAGKGGLLAGARPKAPSTGVSGKLSTGMDQRSLPTGGLSLRKAPKITDEEFESLSAFIYKRTGISIPARRKYLLEGRLSTRIEKLNLKSYKDYYDYLRYDPNRDKEMDHLCERVTTNETSFYRDVRQLGLFQNVILKELIQSLEKTGQKRLRIWSAGCSSGEEPYTLAMMISELLGTSLPGWDIRIAAYDLSPAMLRKAREGYYTDYSLRTTPKNIVGRYFDKEGEGYRIKAKVKTLVSFGPINLSDHAALRRVERSHIVFCRNVIIYFDDDMKRRVISSFYDNLLPGGYLFLGHSETIHKFSTAFKPVIKPGGVCYHKQNGTGPGGGKPGMAKPGTGSTGTVPARSGTGAGK